LWGAAVDRELVKSGKSIQLQRGGYPNLYTGRSESMLPGLVIHPMLIPHGSVALMT
jgi:hypothetical protein